MKNLRIDIVIPPEKIGDDNYIRSEAFKKAGIRDDSSLKVNIRRRSIDARRGRPKFRLQIDLHQGKSEETSFEPPSKNVQNGPEIFIIGTGPAGLFAALRCLERGLKPVLLERGKDVRSRRRDLATLNKEHIVDPDSNYCFGEGGAGTYSDGKLYTRSKKRGSTEEILNYLVYFGADPDILVDAHPHIGTNRLPGIITAIRNHILDCGGEIRFGHKLTDIEIQGGKLKRIQVHGNEWVDCSKMILATGHSARDVFRLLAKRKVKLEAKPFALGIRIEHPQELIDRIQWHCDIRPDGLPPASYSLVQQVDGVGVYSFCMCPGGIIAPCATAPGEIVTNGWSPSKRNNPFANSGIVVEIQAGHFDPGRSGDPLAAMEYQAAVERQAWIAGGQSQSAPAQRMVDFVNGRTSTVLPASSYQPGIVSAHLQDILPKHVAHGLRMAFPAYGKKMKGYYTNEAVLHAVESRTSSPVRIPRHRDSLEHIEVNGLYPCGEGAGYAGGILSAAMDGLKVANAL
jgi:uncharacterized FAD-dependent dehydrogenase